MDRYQVNQKLRLRCDPADLIPVQVVEVIDGVCDQCGAQGYLIKTDGGQIITVCHSALIWLN